FLQRVDGLAYFTLRVLAEHAELEVADITRQHVRRRDRLDVDLVARDRERDRLVDTRPRDLDVHLRAARTAQSRDRIVFRPLARGLAVHFYDRITGAQACTLARRTGQRREHRHPAVALGDLDTDAAILALRLDAQVVVIIRRHEDGVRVAQFLEHPVDRQAIQLATRLGIHKTRRHVPEHVLEQLRRRIHVALAAHTLLQQPAT